MVHNKKKKKKKRLGTRLFMVKDVVLLMIDSKNKGKGVKEIYTHFNAEFQ